MEAWKHRYNNNQPSPSSTTLAQQDMPKNKPPGKSSPGVSSKYSQNRPCQPSVRRSGAGATDSMHSPDTCAGERTFLFSVTPSAEPSQGLTEQSPESPVPPTPENSGIQERPPEPEEDRCPPRSFLFSPASSQSLSPTGGSTAPPIEGTQGRISGSYSPSSSVRVTGPSGHPAVSAAMPSETQQGSLSSPSKPFVGYGDLKSLNPRKDAKTTQDKSRNFSWKGTRLSIDNLPRAGLHSNRRSQVPISTTETTATAGGPGPAAQFTKEADTDNQFTEPSLDLPMPGSSRRQTTCPHLTSGQLGQPSKWPLQQIKKHPTENVAPMQESTSMKNVPAATMKDRARNSITPHRRLFQPVTSRLPKSHTLGNLIPSRQAQGPPGAYTQNNGDRSSHWSQRGEAAREQTSEDITINLHEEKSLGKGPDAIAERLSWRQNAAETEGSKSSSTDDVTMVRNCTIVCV